MRLQWRRQSQPSVEVDQLGDGDSYRCASCGTMHSGLAFAFAAEAPLAWEQLPESERGEGSVLEGELCVIKGEHHFIRGLLEIPVLGHNQAFVWNVWSSLSRDNFERAIEMWESSDRASEPPFFGWLSNDLTAVYPTTLNLKLNVHTRIIGIRPILELERTEHPMAIEQRVGITLDRVREINALVRHREQGVVEFD